MLHIKISLNGVGGLFRFLLHMRGERTVSRWIACQLSCHWASSGSWGRAGSPLGLLHPLLETFTLSELVAATGGRASTWRLSRGEVWGWSVRLPVVGLVSACCLPHPLTSSFWALCFLFRSPLSPILVRTSIAAVF